LIGDNDELEATMRRIATFQDQITQLRRLETDPANYRAAAPGFLAKIDRMQLDVREYLAIHPADPALASSAGERS
jgi:hypothetical protein